MYSNTIRLVVSVLYDICADRFLDIPCTDRESVAYENYLYLLTYEKYQNLLYCIDSFDVMLLASTMSLYKNESLCRL